MWQRVPHDGTMNGETTVAVTCPRAWNDELASVGRSLSVTSIQSTNLLSSTAIGRCVALSWRWVDWRRVCWEVSGRWHRLIVVIVAGTSQQRTLRPAASNTAGHTRRPTYGPSIGLLLTAHWTDWSRPQRPHAGADCLSYTWDLWVLDSGDKTPSVCHCRARRSEQ